MSYSHNASSSHTQQGLAERGQYKNHTPQWETASSLQKGLKNKDAVCHVGAKNHVGRDCKAGRTEGENPSQTSSTPAQS